MALPVRHDGETFNNAPREHCCLCRGLTRYWYVRADVALCEVCAETAQVSDIPRKEDWLEKERALDPSLVSRRFAKVGDHQFRESF